MTAATRDALVALNRDLYQRCADHFDQTRTRPWSGWNDVVAVACARPPKSLLDVGCGNGRFGTYLHGRLASEFTYHGVDSSAQLLQIAQRRLAGIGDVSLTCADILTDPIDRWARRSDYDLVVLFGVLHHVPERARREDLLRRLADRVAPKGHLALSIWRFQTDDSIVGKAVPAGEIAHRTGLTIDPDGLEPGDYVLPWGSGEQAAYRYCHAFTDEELEALANATGRERVLDRYGDGSSGQLNRYWVIR